MVISVLLFILCLAAGSLVSIKYLAEKIQGLDHIRGIAEGSKVKVYVGIASIVIGIWSLVRNDFIGDLIPAILLIASGLTLASIVFNYFNLSADSEKSESRKSLVKTNLEQYTVPIGFTTLLFGIIHLIDIIAGGGSLFI